MTSFLQYQIPKKNEISSNVVIQRRQASYQTAPDERAAVGAATVKHRLELNFKIGLSPGRLPLIIL